MSFSEQDKLRALAIVNIFETSKAFGDYAACVVLDDGAGVSYGINQFTHRSGSLEAVVAEYLNAGGVVGREILSSRLADLRRRTTVSINKLSSDEGFKKALRAAAVTREMKESQAEVAFERYLRPAIDICVSLGFVLPLSLAVVYDSVTHGSWERIAAKVSRDLDEKDWISEYIRKRHFWLSHITRLKATSYRTKFFLDQIATANWQLDRPMNVHGVRLLPAMFAGADGLAAATATQTSDSSNTPHSSADNDPPETHLQPPILTTAEDAFDRVDEIVAGVATRTDRAKSLWTTVIGTLWQTAWAVRIRRRFAARGLDSRRGDRGPADARVSVSADRDGENKRSEK